MDDRRHLPRRFHYHLDFKKGENVGGLQKSPTRAAAPAPSSTGSPTTRCLPTSPCPADTSGCAAPQAVVNAASRWFSGQRRGWPRSTSCCYENGIADYASELAGDKGLTPVLLLRRGHRPRPRGSAGLPGASERRLLLLQQRAAAGILPQLQLAGTRRQPRARRPSAFVNQINAWLKNTRTSRRSESAISFQDVQDCLVLVSSSFSTRTSYENQTKKAITNKFVSQAMTDFLKH